MCDTYPICNSDISDEGRKSLVNEINNLKAPAPLKVVQSVYNNVNEPHDDKNRRHDLLNKYCAGLGNESGTYDRLWGKIKGWVSGQDKDPDIANTLHDQISGLPNKDNQIRYLLCQQIAQNVAPPMPVEELKTDQISSWYNRMLSTDYDKILYGFSFFIGFLILGYYTMDLWKYFKTTAPYNTNAGLIYSILVIGGLILWLGYMLSFGIEYCIPGHNTWYNTNINKQNLNKPLVYLSISVSSLFLIFILLILLSKWLKCNKLGIYTVVLFMTIVYSLDLLFFTTMPTLFVITVIFFRIISYTFYDIKKLRGEEIDFGKGWNPPLMAMGFTFFNWWLFGNNGAQTGGRKKRRRMKGGGDTTEVNNQSQMSIMNRVRKVVCGNKTNSPAKTSTPITTPPPTPITTPHPTPITTSSPTPIATPPPPPPPPSSPTPITASGASSRNNINASKTINQFIKNIRQAKENLRTEPQFTKKIRNTARKIQNKNQFRKNIQSAKRKLRKVNNSNIKK